MKNEKIRNIAIIAHVDHGKTSLVNEMLKQGNVFRENQVVEDRVMDSNALERERGITIFSKNASCMYNDVKINVVDTPGHADFGGEVERVLKMVDGVLLVVDAYEGPMPQTRFVLEKALSLKLKVIVVVNKIDKPDARVKEVIDEVLELFLELDADEEQLNSPFVFASARRGIASTNESELGENFNPLFETIINHIPAPEGESEQPLKLLISSAEHNDYVGKLAVGKIERGSLKVGQNVSVVNFHEQDKKVKSKIVSLFVFEGLKRIPVESASMGEIVCVAGLENVTIGDTICDENNIEPIEFVKIAEPSVEMTFMVNDSPFAGKEGKFVTSRHLRDRLYKEAVKDLSLRVEDGETADAFKVRGRGEMHLSILIENMRRDGFEFQVSMPKVLFKQEDGQKLEPIDKLYLDVPEDCVGTVMNKMGVRKGELLQMTPHANRMKMEFLIPSRGLFGFKSEFLTDTKGEGIINSLFECYAPYKGEIQRRDFGSLIAHEEGEAIVYGLFNAQERGELLIGAGVPVYAGMVVGINPKGDDIVVNVCKKKHLSNCRASGSDDALRLTPPRLMSLEDAIEFLGDDEYLEVTPKSIRIRKIILDHNMRLREKGKMLRGEI
ncbi:MAG: translational GTPase TypA [Clostridia bacterium]|nr:translational GTPase TypA [Clostridia bacterium]MBQ8845503.1 translational GTPase TypA [Clostridia bacterium]